MAKKEKFDVIIRITTFDLECKGAISPKEGEKFSDKALEVPAEDWDGAFVEGIKREIAFYKDHFGAEVVKIDPGEEPHWAALDYKDVLGYHRAVIWSEYFEMKTDGVPENIWNGILD